MEIVLSYGEPSGFSLTKFLLSQSPVIKVLTARGGFFYPQTVTALKKKKKSNRPEMADGEDEGGCIHRTATGFVLTSHLLCVVKKETAG